MDRRRVVLVDEFPSPYRTASYARLSDLEEGQLLVLFLASGGKDRDWGELDQRFPFAVASGDHPWRAGLWAAHKLIRERPGVVIVSGWDRPGYWIAWILKPFLGYCLDLWCVSHQSRSRSRAKTMTKKVLVRWADDVIVPGIAARDYVTTLGADHVLVAPHSIDNDLLAGFEERDTVPRALFVGRLSPEKGLRTLLVAWSMVEKALPEVELMIIGSGPEEAALRALARSLELKRIRWLKYQPWSALPALYADAKVLVSPSTAETWGYAVNEALASGIPVIASDAVGAAYDLVLPGETGWRFAPGDDQDLARILLEAFGDPERTAAMGRRGRDLVRLGFTPRVWAQKVHETLSAGGDHAGSAGGGSS